MLTGLQIDNCELQRETIRKHDHFVKTLNCKKRDTVEKYSQKDILSTRSNSTVGTCAPGKPKSYQNMYHRQQQLDVLNDFLEYERLPNDYKQMLDDKVEIEKMVQLESLRKMYKGPSQNNTDILAHFYNLQQEELGRLAKYNLSSLALRHKNKKLSSKAFHSLFEFTFKKSI